MAIYSLKTFLDIINAVREELKTGTTDTTTLNRIKRDINIVYKEVIAEHKWWWLSQAVDLSLEPTFSTGTASVTQNSNEVTLTVAPAPSKTGYKFSVDGFHEIYEIESHTAGSTTLKLDNIYNGTTNATASFKIWTNKVALPTDCKETTLAYQDYNTVPLESCGLQEFRRTCAALPKAEGAPRYYYTSEYKDTSDSSTASIPSASTRASEGLVKTLVFSDSLPSTIIEGSKLRVSKAGHPSYVGDIFVGSISTTNTANDTITYTGRGELTESTTSDTAIEVRRVDSESINTRYRELFYHPSITSVRSVLHIDYMREAPDLENDSDEPIIPLDDRVVLLYGALERAWDRERNLESSAKANAKYVNKLAKMAGKLQDTFDKPVIQVSKSYLSAKRNVARGRSVGGASSNGIGGSGAAPTIIGSAGKVAKYDSNGLLGSSAVSDTELSTTVTEVAAATSSNTPLTLVERDASGNFSAGTITATLSGNASTVTTNANLTGPITSVGNATFVASQTGTGSTFVMNTSPTLVTPALGVATVTTINKVALTAPASGSTLTIADGKTLTVNRTLTFTGTDSTTMTFPSTTATIARTDAAQTFTGVQTFSSAPAMSALTASQAVFTDGSKNLTSNAITGTGNVVMSASPTLTGTVSGANSTWSGTQRVNGFMGMNVAPGTYQLDILSALTSSTAGANRILNIASGGPTGSSGADASISLGDGVNASARVSYNSSGALSLMTNGTVTLTSNVGGTGIVIPGTLAVQGTAITLSDGNSLNWGGTTNLIYGSNASNYVRIRTNSVDRILVDSAGAVSMPGTLGVTGLVTATGGLAVAGGSFAAGRLYKDATLGLAIAGVTGSSSDMWFGNNAGSTVMEVPTGTNNLSLSGNLSVSRGSASDVTATIANTTASSAAHSTIQSTVNGASGGDPKHRFLVSGGSEYAIGVDNSDGDSFKISENANLGTNDRITIAATTGVVTIPNQLIAKGTSTNDSASTGYIGEFVSSTISPPSDITLTTGTAADITSISLTAGDWDVWGKVIFTGSITGTATMALISSTSASNGSTTTMSRMETPTVPTSSGNLNLGLPTERFSLSATTTIYLIGRMNFSAGTGKAYGFIAARRMR